MSIALSLSPLPTILKIYQNRSTMSFSVLPYAASAAQSSMWLVFSSFADNKALIPVNSWGVAIYSLYSLIFLFFGSNKTEIAAILAGSAGVLVGLWGLAAISPSPADYAQFGAMILNICMFASPLTVVRRVIETKSVAFMPLPLSAASLACALSWFVYGISIGLFGVIIPNGLGTILGLAQVMIYFKYAGKEEVIRDSQVNSSIGNEKRPQVI